MEVAMCWFARSQVYLNNRQHLCYLLLTRVQRYVCFGVQEKQEMIAQQQGS